MRHLRLHLLTRCSRALSAWRRWPAHRWLLIVLIWPTLRVVTDVLSDWGPFEGWVQYVARTRLDRQALGYNKLPPYHDRAAALGGGYFNAYDGGRQHWSDGRFGYHSWDVPYWPDGDPGLGANNPLPPLVMRNEIYAVTPQIPLAVLAVGWLGWGLLFGFHRQRQSPRRRGFEVLAPVETRTSR